jgi:NADH:ubiquinone oxidoreductase subunit D
MMAIVGEPSADGLVMEPIELGLGPLALVLPAGLRVSVTLDGDVVSACEVAATLHADADPLAPAAWAAVQGERTGWSALADVELERLVSHLAWLRSFARLLGWAELTARCRAALAPVLEARRHVADDPRAAVASLAAADSLVQTLVGLAGGRRMRRRTVGRGVVPAAGAEVLRGPNARASGAGRDARAGDPRYAALEFEPVVADDGDARARVCVRAREAAEAVRLARGALERASRREAAPDVTGSGIEGPRGPAGLRSVTDAALRVAGDAAVGHEWASALVVLASFDLSPWRVGE